MLPIPFFFQVTNHDLMMQLNQYGFIKGISKLGARESAVKKSIALVDFKDAISVRKLGNLVIMVISSMKVIT